MRLLDNIFKEDMSTYTTYMSKQVFLRIFVIGLANGVITWLLSLAFYKFMLMPVFCSSGSENIVMCSNSANIASYVAIVVVGMMTVPLLAVVGIRRAILVMAASVASLWGISAWSDGPWLTSVLITALSFGLVYVAITWINRIRGSIGAVLVMVVFVILARVVLGL